MVLNPRDPKHLPIERCAQVGGNGGAECLCGVTRSFRMRDEAGDGRLGCGTTDLELERDLLERSGRTPKIELVRDAEHRAHIDRRVFDRHVIERRKLRQLGEQSERRARHDVLERRGGKVVSSSLGRLVGLDPESPDPACHVEVAVDPRDGR